MVMAEETKTNTSRKRSVHLFVAKDVARKILSGKWSVGRIIPGEMELCERYKVSRTALREAIKLLNAKGLLESRPKIGTRVRAREHWNFLDVQLLEWMNGLSNATQVYHDFLALRRSIEPEAAILAAQNGTPEQKQQLCETMERMEALVNGDPSVDWLETDMEFHRQIFLATGNHFFIPFANVLRTMFTTFPKHSSNLGNANIAFHREVCDAIVEGDVDAAREASIKLLGDSRRHKFEALANTIQKMLG